MECPMKKVTPAQFQKQGESFFFHFFSFFFLFLVNFVTLSLLNYLD